MPLFRNRKSKSPSNPSTPSPPSRFSARSVEQLVHPAFAAAPPALINNNNNNSNPRLDDYTDHRLSYHRLNLNYDGSAPHSDLPPPTPSHQRPPQLHHQPQEPTQSSLHRSQSQRQPHLQQRERPTVSVVAPEDPHPRRSKKSLSGFLERSVSTKGKSISHPISQPTSPQHSPHETLGPTHEDQYQPSYSDNSSPITSHPAYDPRAALAHQQQQYQQHQTSRDNLDWPPQQLQQPLHQSQPGQSQSQLLQQPVQLQQRPFPSPLERTSTDISLLEQPSNRTSPTDAPESPRYPDQQSHRGQPQRIQEDLVFNSRPPSRQTLESLASVPAQIHPDGMQQASAPVPPPHQSQQRPPSVANERAPGDSGRRDSTAQTMPDTGRGTPTGTRTIEDPGEIDVRALLQKHEELREYALRDRREAVLIAD